MDIINLRGDLRIRLNISPAAQTYWAAVYLPVIRQGWIRPGAAAVIRVDRTRRAQSCCGFLNTKTGDVDVVAMAWQDTDNIIPVLREITR
ncbi:hypothetical protein CCYS_09645 [Corynebacterium cystitidis DSM 20524]|uniref:Uncharacterized protein n=1 Tax=Corynebacterium cystitidis DSM 20524 TaxID=1121357 RepID=A0A1H9VQQ6_9CORY|nr:hypothetical protein CCYS_09645 [Corynebacterium cystitidis DSM 20524]SES23888.1 hypothetical protein SAMN05661109_02360 [Corynebacterium cystitidis DSM 20524]SNV69898.1 transposase [Corynebacterium cystitidis]